VFREEFVHKEVSFQNFFLKTAEKIFQKRQFYLYLFDSRL
jgi:hypothetical protein